MALVAVISDLVVVGRDRFNSQISSLVNRMVNLLQDFSEVRLEIALMYCLGDDRSMKVPFAGAVCRRVDALQRLFLVQTGVQHFVGSDVF